MLLQLRAMQSALRMLALKSRAGRAARKNRQIGGLGPLTPLRAPRTRRGGVLVDTEHRMRASDDRRSPKLGALPPVKAELHA